MWIAYMVATLPLIIVGMIIPFLFAYAPRTSKQYPDGRMIMAYTNSAVDSIWGNNEDGIDGIPRTAKGEIFKNIEWVAEQHVAQWSEKRTVWEWSAWRNSTANLRFWKVLGIVINPSKIKSVGRFTFQGPYAALTTTKIHIGWKIFPTDAGTSDRIPATDTRYPGVGFGLSRVS